MISKRMRARLRAEKTAVAKRRALRLASEAQRGLMTQVHSRGVGIVQLKNQQEIGLGSGTCVRIGDRYFIATAAHVICDAPINELCLVPEGGPTPHSRRVALLGMKWSGGGDYDDIDVGWIEVEPAAAKRMNGKTFITLDRVLPFCTPKRGKQMILLWGAPWALVDQRALQEHYRVDVRFATFLTPPLPRSRWPWRGKGRNDIFLSYPTNDQTTRRVSDDAPAVPPNPQGMSGGGMWLHEFSDEVWLPERSMLIGIDRSWSPSEQYARGTRIEHWLRLVAKDFPDLRAEIRAHLKQSRVAKGERLK